MNTLECLLKIWDTYHNSTNATRYERWQNKLYCCLQNGLSVLDEDISYKNTYKHKVLNDDYYKILKENIDNVISYSVTFKRVVERLKKFNYQVYFCNGILTIYKDGYDKVSIEKAFGNDYSIDSINKRLYSSRQIVFKPIPQRTIFEEYFRTNKHHKGIYGLYLYYCYLLKVFPQKHPKQYLPYSIR